MTTHESHPTPAPLPAGAPTAAKPAPKSPADQHDAKAKAPAKPKPKKEKELRPLQAYAGTVVAYQANPDGLYDTFTLATTGGKTYPVKFPPHFAERLRELAQPGQPATVLGFLHTTPKGDEHLHLARVEAGGASARPLPPPGPAEAVTLTGTVAELLHTPKGHLHGLRLAGQDAELRLPPHLGQQLAERLVPGTSLVASGQRRTPRPGEVAAHPAPVQLALLELGTDAFLLH